MDGYYEANVIRRDAMSGQFSVVELAEQHGRPVPTIYKILEGQIWVDKNTTPICMRAMATAQRIANIHILHKLGFTYDRIGRYIGKAGDTARKLAGRKTDATPNVSVVLEYTVTAKDGSAVKPNGYQVMPVEDDLVMLSNGDDSYFVYIDDLRRKVRLPNER